MTENQSLAHSRRPVLRFALLFYLALVSLNAYWVWGATPWSWATRLRSYSQEFQQLPSLRAYVANTGSDSVSVIDLTTGTSIGLPISVGREPSALAVSPDQRRVYVANSGTNTVSVIDAESNTVITTIRLRRSARATGLALSLDGSRLFVTNGRGDTVFIVDTETNNTIGLPIRVDGGPSGLVWTDNPEPRLYISTPERRGVTSVDFSGLTTRRFIETGPNPAGMALSLDGGTVYVADVDESKVSVISTASNDVGRSFPIGHGTDSLDLTPEGKRLVVASLRSPEATIVNPVDGSVIATVPTGSSAMTGRPGLNRVAVAPDGLSAVVANEDDDTITIINLKTNTVRNVVSVEDQPTGVAVVGKVAVCDPDRTTIDFGDVQPGRGAQRDLLITNRGTDTLRITGAVIDNPAFEIGGVPLAIAPRETGRFVVRFNPTTLGEHFGTLELQTNDPDPDRCTIRLRGFGRSPICTVTPTSLDFGVVRIGQRAELPVVVGNVGNQRLTITRVDSTDPQFELAGPGLPFSVEPGAFQTIVIGFTPGAIRVQSALLRLVGNDPDLSRCVIAAQGIGQGPLVPCQFGSCISQFAICNGGSPYILLWVGIINGFVGAAS